MLGGLVTSAPASAAASQCGILQPDETLERGESVSSCNGQYRFVHQTDGNVVLYGPSGALWASGTAGLATNTLLMQSFDGNLALYGPSGAVWDANSRGGISTGPDGSLAIQDDGNVVGNTFFGRPVWGRTPGAFDGRLTSYQPWPGHRYEVIYTTGNIFNELPPVTLEVSIRSSGGLTVASYFRPL